MSVWPTALQVAEKNTHITTALDHDIFILRDQNLFYLSLQRKSPVLPLVHLFCPDNSLPGPAWFRSTFGRVSSYHNYVPVVIGTAEGNAVPDHSWAWTTTLARHTATGRLMLSLTSEHCVLLWKWLHTHGSRKYIFCVLGCEFALDVYQIEACSRSLFVHVRRKVFFKYKTCITFHM